MQEFSRAIIETFDNNDVISMSPLEQAALLNKAKEWFAKVIMKNHVANTEKLADIDEFTINPFLLTYLAAFYSGEDSAEAKAEALLLPRVLGTSINTSFGTNIQAFITEVLRDVAGSTTEGIDIEFIDASTREKTYCQVKLGPNTINKDDVETIHRHFDKARRLAKTNRAQSVNFMVGVMYGEASDLSTHYKKLQDDHHYDVFIGQAFWERLTGSNTFYGQLQQAFAEVAIEAKGSELITSVVAKLAKQIRKQGI